MKQHLLNLFRNTKFFLLVVIALALVYRIGYFVLLENGTYITNNVVTGFEKLLSQQAITSPTYNSEAIGRNMLGYPLILAVSYLISGGLFLARIFNILFSAFTCLIIYFIGKELSGKTIGKIGALLYAFYFPAIRWVPMAHMETFQIFITTLSIYYMIIALKCNKAKYYVVAAGVFFLSIFTKPMPVVFLLVFVPLVLIRNKKSIKKGLIYSFIFILINVLLLTPWAIRNYRKYDTLMFFSFHGGRHFWVGNQVHFEIFKGGWLDERTWLFNGHPELEDVTLPEEKPTNPVLLDRYNYRLGLEFIKRYPKVFLELIPVKFYNVWRLNYEGNKNPLRITSELFGYLLLLPFFLFAGLYYLKPRKFFKEINFCLIPFLFVVTHAAIFVVFPGLLRYRLFLIPCIQIVGLCGIEMSLNILKEAKKPS